MPKVSINIIKEWFKNQSKPPQEQFWAWLDSFWHKDESIPQSAVENLSTALKLKADLVNGVVPEDQLPFSVVTSEVITLGLVELIGNKTYLRVHSSGANKVRVKGKLITRTFQNQWTITPIAADGVKVLRGYAVKSNDDFLLAEGAELPTYVEPEIPEDALEIFKITMRSSGNVIEQTETGLKYIAEDGWRNILLTEDLTVLPYNFDLKSSYWINTRVANPVIGGIHNGVIDRNASPTWDGKEFWLFNNTGGDLLLDPANVTAIDVFLFSDRLMPLTVKNNNAVLLKLKDNVIEIMQVGGGDVDLSAYALDADLDAEIVNRAIADLALDGKITAEKNRNDSQDLEIATKLTKPTAPNNTSDRLLTADGGTTAKSNYQRNKQFFVPLPETVSEDWKGCMVFFTSSGTLTVPTGLTADFTFNGIVDSGVSLTPAITTPMTWLGTAPAAIVGVAIFTMVRRDGTNNFQILGV